MFGEGLLFWCSVIALAEACALISMLEMADPPTSRLIEATNMQLLKIKDENHEIGKSFELSSKETEFFFNNFNLHCRYLASCW